MLGHGCQLLCCSLADRGTEAGLYCSSRCNAACLTSLREGKRAQGGRWIATAHRNVRAETDERSRRSMERRLRYSGIKGFKTMADFDWNWPAKIERDVIERALTLDFLSESRNLVLVGRNGLGKTMIAQNICHQAVLAGSSVFFRSAPALLEDLHRQTPEGRRRKLRSYANVGLLCVDLCEVVSNVE